MYSIIQSLAGWNPCRTPSSARSSIITWARTRPSGRITSWASSSCRWRTEASVATLEKVRSITARTGDRPRSHERRPKEFAQYIGKENGAGARPHNGIRARPRAHADCRGFAKTPADGFSDRSRSHRDFIGGIFDKEWICQRACRANDSNDVLAHRQRLDHQKRTH